MMQLCRLPMLLLVVGWTTVTHFSGVSPNLIFTDYSLSKIVQPELLQIQVNILWYSGNSIGSLFSFTQSSNCLPWCTSLFILAYPYLSTYHNTYNTRCSQSVANFLNIPKFQPKIHKSTKQFGFSFTFDAPTVWNSLPEDICASPTIAYFRKKLQTYLYAKAYPP